MNFMATCTARPSQCYQLVRMVDSCLMQTSDWMLDCHTHLLTAPSMSRKLHEAEGARAEVPDLLVLGVLFQRLPAVDPGP